MAYFTTGLDLKLDALDMAGEPATGSEFDALVYEFLTVVERAVVSGGTFGAAQLEPADWYWARAWPRGTIQLVQPYNADNALEATFTAGSRTVVVNTLSAAVQLPDLSGYRIMRPDVPARHFILNTQNTGTSTPQLKLQDPWTGDSDTTDVWLAYPDTYMLPEDFVRGTSPLFLYGFPANVPSSTTIDVVDPVDLERLYPQNFPWGGNTTATVVGSGLPVMAARVTDKRIRFSHFLQTPDNPLPCQVEFEYIREPPLIAEGSIPLIPIQHRRALSYGAAYLILNEKNDTTADDYLKLFVGQWQAMRQEHARDMRRMSSRWGVIQPPRLSGNFSFRLTETGLPVYVW